MFYSKKYINLVLLGSSIFTGLGNSLGGSSTTDESLLRGRSLATGCCSLNFKDCDGPFCGSTKEACESCDQQPVVWLPDGEITGCKKKWEDCSSDPDGCCSPGQCVPTTEEHSQCIYVPPTHAPSDAPSQEPSAAPTPEPVHGGCCSVNFKNCDGTWCGSTQEQCESCEQNVDVTWLPNGSKSWCFAKWADCTNSRYRCCSPAQCVKVTDEHYQCKPVSD
mmetsp:Transcript_31366/g.93863  ORF Transcript_31366/g.93863 Transcript_31366/m.93863 type:complete len:220 (-) Transcript_31366:289-948(-)